MNQARLIVPSQEYLEGYLQFCREIRATGITYYTVHDPDAFDEWRETIVSTYRDHRQGKNLPEGWVPASTFWLVEGDAFLGEVNIRHELTPHLRQFGGNIGYGILPSKWRMGYGTLQLKLALEEARKLGMERALVTCDDTNPGSAKVIENNGGQLEGVFEMQIEGVDRKIRRYWIELAP